MIDAAVNSVSLESVEAVLREELARGDAMTDTVVPILRHLLGNDGNSIFSDEVVASVRGMMTDIACQLLDKLNEVSGDQPDPDDISALTDAFITNAALVGHVHALALETQFTNRLHAKLALDPVLSPLLQALIASQDEATASLAMKLLAAQARFCQSQRRMQLPLNELPGDLLHSALLSMRTLAGTEPEVDERAAAAEAQIRLGYDEAATRLGLISRLVEGMASGAIAALAVRHAGASIFLSAVAIGSGQDRDTAVFSTDEAQAARLALGLRAAGLKQQAIEEQFLALHPEVCLPEGFDRLTSDRSAAILSVASYRGG
ncbi:MAG: hypothetical protein P8J20_10995 [Novosphingobium sp.]|nr:hypothetical protein [Novosphingobium sp.]